VANITAVREEVIETALRHKNHCLTEIWRVANTLMEGEVLGAAPLDFDSSRVRV